MNGMPVVLRLLLASMIVVIAPRFGHSNPGRSTDAASGAKRYLRGCRIAEILDPPVAVLDPSGIKGCQVDSSEKAKLGQRDVVFLCGTTRLCGQKYEVVMTPGGVRYLYQGTRIRVVEPKWERRDVPEIASAPPLSKPASTGICLEIEVVSDRPALFFPLEQTPSDSWALVDAARLTAGEKLLACSQEGSVLMGYRETQPGFFDMAVGHATGKFVEERVLQQDAVCSKLVWPAVLRRDSYFYQEDSGRLRRNDKILRKGMTVWILSVLPGAEDSDRAWYQVAFGSEEGILPPSSLELSGPPSVWKTSKPRRYCPQIEGFIRTDCTVSGKPVRWADSQNSRKHPTLVELHGKSLFPLLHSDPNGLTVLAFDLVVDLPWDECIVGDSAPPVLAIRKSPWKLLPELLEFDPSLRDGGAGQAVERYPLPSPSVCAYEDNAAELALGHSAVLQLLDSGVPAQAVRKRLRDLVRPGPVPLSALCALAQHGVWGPLLGWLLEGERAGMAATTAATNAVNNVHNLGDSRPAPVSPVPGLLRKWCDTTDGEPRWARLACLLLKGCYRFAVGHSRPCFLKPCGQCKEIFELAEGLRQFDLHLLSRELFLDAWECAESRDNQLAAVALSAYGEQVRTQGSSHRVIGLLSPRCFVGEGPDTLDICFLAAMAALDRGDDDMAERLGYRMLQLRASQPRHLAVIAQGALEGGRLKRALRYYASVVETELQREQVDESLLEKTLFQMARLALELNDTQLAARVIEPLSLDALSRNFTLAAQILAGTHEFSGLERLVRSRERQAGQPEEYLVLGFCLMLECRFRSAEKALNSASAGVKQLQAWVEQTRVKVGACEADRLWNVDCVLAPFAELLAARQGLGVSEVLEPTTSCSRWRRAEQELLHLGRLTRNLPRNDVTHMNGKLAGIIEVERVQCKDEVGKYLTQLEAHLGNLPIVEVWDDVIYSYEEEIHAAARLLENAFNRARARFCEDWKAWEEGANPGWGQRVEGLPLPFNPDCAGWNLASLPPVADWGPAVVAHLQGEGSRRHKRALVRTWKKQQLAQSAAELLLWPEVTVELEFLAEAHRKGVSDEVVRYLTTRYMPLLRYVTTDLLESRSAKALPESVAEVLRIWAMDNQEISGMCISGIESAN